jgi:hypothetical protein
MSITFVSRLLRNKLRGTTGTTKQNKTIILIILKISLESESI